ncbi:NADH-quinone oxidoreductase subunit N [Fervidibacillus halotolerans]|uniref:NADH-quinone oxidoreductase subunit N n=1 Tax=Fervidibacillus halotolerans TaxID=2980027 RepID=A0A9E8LYL0_9BACI|nr:NADH-quinone oxidoreductase subunit N [Fervidibacillus halotolerans]WAA12163.1 NADH-quinone oxidoreductase subunit N [Fervidibacillus halotolerans]
MDFSYEWHVMTPEFSILMTIILIGILDVLLPKKIDRKWFGWLAVGGTFLSFGLFLTLLPLDRTSILFDTFIFDSFAKGFKFILLFGGTLLLLLAVGSKKEQGMEKYEMEFYVLLLTALFGGMMITSSNDLITLFIGLELVSVSSYVLVGMNKWSKKTNRAALTFLMNGSLATAITLFGMSYLYGIAGTTQLQTFLQHFSEVSNPATRYLYIIGFCFLFIGLSFKWTTMPFSLWAPDVYEGAQTIVTAFLSAFSKIIGLIMFFRLIFTVFSETVLDQHVMFSIFQNSLLILALLSMTFGNMMAIGQRNVKRLLAYSSIAHGGYMLAGIASFSAHSMEAVTYYFLVYSLITIGAFTIVSYITDGNEADEQTFTGLFKTTPLLAISLTIFFISLAGLPPTAGFIGKWKLLISIIDGGSPIHYVTAIGMIGMTIVSYAYYFRIMASMYFQYPNKEEKFSVRLPLVILLFLCIAVTFLIGLLPNFGTPTWI